MIEVLNQSALVLRNTTKKIFQAFILILFFGSIFILLGKQLYKGVLTQKCVVPPPGNISDIVYLAYVSNSSYWLEDKSGYYLCGNSTGSRPCPANYTCLRGANVNSYVSHFNFYGSSVVTISQLLTLHFWQELYQRMLLTAGTLHVSYFVLAFYSFLYSTGLILALITRSYKVQLKDFEALEKSTNAALKENNPCDGTKGIAKSPSCKSYELFSSQVLNTGRIERQVSESIDCASQATDKSLESDKCFKERVPECKHQREVKRSQLASESSNDSSSGSCCSSITQCFTSVQKYIRYNLFGFCSEMFFVSMIVVFLCVAVLRFSHILDHSIYDITYKVFAVVSMCEVLLKLVAYGPQLYFQNKWNGFDAIVLLMGGSEIILFQSGHSMMFLLKAFKLVRVMVCSATCNYLKCVMDASLFMFKHPTSVLLAFMCICIVSGMQLYGTEYFQSEDRFPNQDPPRWYFKDCYSSFLLVFCMLCGDWKQPMVNTVLFTSCASDLLMLIFVLFGNLVIMNLFMGMLFYTFFYKTFSKHSCDKEQKLQNAFQVILQGQNMDLSSKANFRDKHVDDIQVSTRASSSDIVSAAHENPRHPMKREKRSVHGFSRSQKEMENGDDSSSEYMADCCPTLCYFCCSFCKADENPVLWQNWAEVRCKLYCFVETKPFRITVIVVILLSIALLVISRSPGSSMPEVVQVLQVLDPCICLLFTMEMFLKWMAYGLQKYFKSHLGRLEFFIVLVYLVDLMSMKFFDGQKNIFKALKSFRLLSITPLIKSYQETVPLPMKRNDSIIDSDSASKESLLHLRRMECNNFLGRHCRYRPTGSGEIFQMDWNVTDVTPGDLCESKMRRVELNNVTEFRNKSSPVEASHCFPDIFYNLFSWCTEDCSFWNIWKRIRTKVLMVVSSKYFSVFHGLVIVASCLMLALEASFSGEQPTWMTSTSYYFDRVFAVLFFLQVTLKCFGIGFHVYFSYFCIMELLVSTASILYFVLDELEVGRFPILKIVRVLLLLYLCKVLSWNKQAKNVLSSLSQALTAYAATFVFVVFLWLAFAIMGVAMFEQRLLRCVDGSGAALHQFWRSPDAYQNELDCTLVNGTVKNSALNFDSVENAYIALLQVATLQDWISFVTDIMDNTQDENRMRYELYTAIFFPCFIMFSTFLTVNLFAGVTCWYFNDHKGDKEKGLNHHSESLYKAAVRKMERTKLKRVVPQPKLQFQAFLYRMVMSDNFEIAGFVLIGLHMLLIALDMYDPSPSEMFVLAMTELNVFFIVIFTVEIVVKLLALRGYFFLSLWNHFDVAVVGLCISGALFPDLFSSPMLPAMLRLLRFLKCTRYLRRYARGMLPLIYSLYSSIPAFLALFVLQFIIMFIYAVFGVFLFRDVNQSWDISGELSFETFPKTMLLLFQMSTLAGWVEVLESLSSGELGITYVVSYIIIIYYIIIKTHLIVMLDSYETAMLEYENILLQEDYEMFAEVWQKFDSHAKGILKFNHLSDLLDAMEEPFHFCKPNRFLIASLNIPIYEGELIFYADVMDALTRDFMSRNAHLLEATDSIPGLLDSEGKTLRKIGSSLWRQRQNHCAHVIQRAWHRFIGVGQLAQSPVFYSEVKLSETGDRVDTFLTAEVRSSSHASV